MKHSFSLKDKSTFQNRVISTISKIAEENNYKTYLVGGYVRDQFLGIESNDIDVIVIGDAIKFAKLSAERLNTELSAVYKKFGTALIKLPFESAGPNSNILKIEFASARKESYRKNSRKPIVEFSDLEDDLSRRDFTVNTLAISLNSDDFSELIDRFNGLKDLKHKVLRTPLSPLKTFNDDPLRMLRAIRFASQLNFEVEEDTFNAINKMRSRLRIEKSSPVSQERITDEFLKILSTRKPSIGLSLLQKSGLMKIIFQEVYELEGVEQRRDYHHKDVFYHTLQVVDNISLKTDNLWLRFAALMHDIAKPATKKFVEGTGWTFHGHEETGAKWQKNIFKKLKLPLDKLNYVEKLVKLHLRPIALANEGVTDSAIRRLIFETGDYINDLMTLCRADITSKDPKKVKEYTFNFDRVEKRIKEVEERDRIRNFQSPVRGEEIMKICNIPQSKQVGIIKSKIEEAILEGIIPNDYEAALEYLNKVKDELLI
ncbi:MAG: CCA tRNA nucleotidyltransferase [Ignavibacteria bacterium]